MAGCLFDHSGDIRVTSTITMVEDVLVTLGHFLNDCRDDAADAMAGWRVKHGSATVEIQLLPRGADTHLRVASGVVHAGDGTDRAALWQELHAAAAARVRQHAPAPPTIRGSDADPRAVRSARDNAARAGVTDWIEFGLSLQDTQQHQQFGHVTIRAGQTDGRHAQQQEQGG